MGRSRLGWACNAIAPWCLAVGVVVSITAEAGQDPARDAGLADSSVRQALLSSTFQLPGRFFGQMAGGSLFLDASLTLGADDELTMVDDEIDPRMDLKQLGAALPTVDRTGKGDPLLGLRPGFSARLMRHPAPSGGASATPADEDAISFADPFEASNPAVAASVDAPGADAPIWLDPGAANKKPLRFDDGATPSVPLDIALNSSSPAPSDDTPIAAIAAEPEAPRSDSSQVAQSPAGGPPNYAALIDPKDGARQQRCLAEAIYFEARSEPAEGQAAVAQVVLNRVRSGLYPANVCAVVYQDRNRPFACQFSFACEGRSLRVTEPGPWAVATRIAEDVTDGKIYNAKVGSALNYHANYVMPYWANALKRVDRIGHHIFYELRVSQN
jgi:spore germination cell wall hydrolase CwlJ-like protein